MEWWLTLLVVAGALLFLFATGLPIFACFMILNVAGVIILMGTPGLGLFVNSMLDTTTSDALVAVPLYVLLGELLFRTGGVMVLFRAFDQLIGAIRGRLYVIAIGVSAVLGAISGSAMATSAILGRYIYPIMMERGCNRRLAIGMALGGATLDAIIPPSVTAIILATLANISIADFLIAGIGPGFFLAACFAIYAVLRTVIDPSLDSRGDDGLRQLAWSERLRVALPLLPLGGIIFLVIGLVMFGIAEPIEAAAAGIVGALVMSLFFGTFSFRIIYEGCLGATKMTAAVMIIIASSKLFSQLLSYTGATRGLVEFVAEASINPWLLYAIMLTVSFLLCKFIDQVALMLIIVPVYQPLIAPLGFDPVWFWMMFLITILFGGITPPFGYVMFVFKAAAPDVPLGEIYRAVVPVLVCALAAIVIMSIFPGIATWLPSLH